MCNAIARVIIMVAIGFAGFFVSASTAHADNGSGGGGGSTATTCSTQLWNAGSCDLVVVTPVPYTANGSWVQIPWQTPQRSGGPLQPLERGITAAGQHTMRFDTREFGWRMDATCPPGVGSCGMSFIYTNPSTPVIFDIWVYRESGVAPRFIATTFDPNNSAGTWTGAPSYALYWRDDTPVSRRMNVEFQGGYAQWITPSPTGAFFSAQQPGWSAL